VVRGLSRTSISEGKKHMGNGGKEAPVKIDHAKEALESGQIGRRRKGKNRLDFGGERRKTRGSDMVTEAIHFWDSKCAFGRIDAEAIGGQHIKNLPKMEEMLFPGRTENEEVVKVDKKEGEGTEKGIHETLERLGGIFEAKWHEVKFK
jgi:hypothetical protein